MVSAQRRTNLLRVLALLFVIGVTVLILVDRDRFKNLGSIGYPGIFLLSIIANATVIIPVPGVVLTSAWATVFNPFWVAIAAGSGAALGEMSGYLAGFSGQAVVENIRYYERMKEWMARYGSITILVLAFIPNPAFDLAGMTAGVLKMPVYKFLFFTWIGKILKMMLFAYAGSSIMGWFF